MKRVDVAYVLLLDEDEKNILLVKNKSKGPSYYTLPGGAVEKGETLEEAAIREVKEETGLEVQINGVFTISEAFFEERGHHAIFFYFYRKNYRWRNHYFAPRRNRRSFMDGCRRSRTIRAFVR